MRIPPLPRLLAAATIALFIALLISPPSVRAQTLRPAGTRSADEAALVVVTERFAKAFERGLEDSREYWPARGEVTYVHTEHTVHGDSVSTRTYPAGAVFARDADWPFFQVLELDFESQPIGLFVHQLKMRSNFTDLRWRNAGGTRVVPTGEPDDAPFFIEWRREDGKWVISAFGDERFDREPMPKWCC